MKLLSVVAIWLCWVVLFDVLAASARRPPPPRPSPPPPPARPPPPPPNEPTTFDLSWDATTTSYTDSVKSLRDRLKSNNIQYFGVPMMNPPSAPKEFITVDLRGPDGQDVKLGIYVNDMYVVGYQETNRAHFLTDPDHPDIPADAKSKLFPDVKEKDKLDIPYSGSYKDLLAQTTANSRKEIELGIDKLRTLLPSVIGKNIDPNYRKTEARFLITAIQMVSEAARFKYIENQVVSAGDYGLFFPNDKTMSLENNWLSISKAFVQAANGRPISVPLKDETGKLVTVTNVQDLVPDMGILKYATLPGTTFIEGNDGLLLHFLDSPALFPN